MQTDITLKTANATYIPDHLGRFPRLAKASMPSIVSVSTTRTSGHENPNLSKFGESPILLEVSLLGRAAPAPYAE